jgi:cation diffusion facilitator CzcD-associated flavoprotein CzcO
VPAHAYQATFEPSTSWSTAYAAGSEIKSYWKRVVEKYDVGKYIRLNSRVTSAEWSEEKGKWLVTVSSPTGEHVDEADFLVTATGHFSDPRLPNYPGQSEYEGHLRHSSNWDPNFDPTGKKIAVIGYVKVANVSKAIADIKQKWSLWLAGSSPSAKGSCTHRPLRSQ